MVNHQHGQSLSKLYWFMIILAFVPDCSTVEPEPEPGQLAARQNLPLSTANHVDSTNSITTDNLIRNILLNQSAEYYDELVLEQLLAAANMSSPPPETWRTILMLLSRNMNATKQQQQLHDEQHQESIPLDKSKNSLPFVNINVNDSLNNGHNNGNENVTIKKQTKKPKESAQSAIDEFPPDFMSEETRQKGGFVVHIIIFIYLCIVLAVVCDNYFLKSLEYISESKFHIRDFILSIES